MRLVDGTYDVGKVYATVLDKRIRAITEGKVLEEQGVSGEREVASSRYSL